MAISVPPVKNPPVITLEMLKALMLSSPKRSSFTITRFNDPNKEIYNWKRQGHSAAEATTKFYHKLIRKSVIGPNNLLDLYKPLGWNFVLGNPAFTNYFNATYARLGVSDDGSSPTDYTVSVLNPADGTTQAYYQSMDLGWPVLSTNFTTNDTLTWEASYPTGIAEFDWTAFGVDNDFDADGAGTATTSYNGSTILLMNRLVTDEGTKGAGQLWILTLNITQI